MLAEIGIRYLKITHAGRLEGAKARRIKQFRESELKYIKPIRFELRHGVGQRFSAASERPALRLF